MENLSKALILWLKWASGFTLFLVSLYLILHFFLRGQEEVSLSIEELTAVNTLITNHDDSINTKKLIYIYIDSRYELINKRQLRRQIKTMPLDQLQQQLPHQKLTVKSFFWLDPHQVLWEVAFWSLFGLMANLFFSVTTAKAFDPKKIPEHIGKLIYTPFLAIIVYLSLNALVNTGSISLEGVGKSTIVLAFVLGFYTRRAIVLLGRVKDLILPAKERENKGENDQDNENEVLTGFKALADEDQKRIINAYIQANADMLKERYPEIQGISARKKIRNGLMSDYYCVHFDVIEKYHKISDEKRIPHFIEYTDMNNKFKIETDISGSGENKLAFIPAKFHGDGEEPKQLGLSCSREGVNEMGTIGLKVYKKGKAYLLSCYHVLCAPEMNAYWSEFHPAIATQSVEVFSPGVRDGKNPKAIAEVMEGTLNNFTDAAIAKLKDEDMVQPTLYGGNVKPNGITVLDSDHSENNYKVYLYGRTSGKSIGTIKDSHQNTVFFKEYPKDTLKGNKFYHLIVASKMSQEGDSGAVVVDDQNRIIGILLGSNSKYSYIQPINTIINQLNLDEL